MRSALRTREVERLEQGYRSLGPDLSGLLDLSLDEVTARDLNVLRDAVGALLSNRGFDLDWEPNSVGRECEALLDRLSPCHWAKDAERWAALRLVATPVETPDAASPQPLSTPPVA